MLDYELIHARNILNEFETQEDFFEYFESLEKREYEVLTREIRKFVKCPNGHIYSFNKLERFAKNQKLKFGDGKDIEMQKAYHYMFLREIYLEIKHSISADEEYKKYCLSLEVLKKSKNENEIIEAKNIIERYEISVDEGIFGL
jgi:hypothetical protein